MVKLPLMVCGLIFKQNQIKMKGIINKLVQDKQVDFGKIHSFREVYLSDKRSNVKRWYLGVLLFLIIIMFLPWTQNIRAKGTVTTLRQEHRPQEINTIISGKIIKWYVKEGDFVRAGDTLVQLTEVKESYLDPNLVGRTYDQIVAKKSSVDFYHTKVKATDQQITAMSQARHLKIKQLENKLKQLALKITADSMEMVAAGNDFKIASEQLKRMSVLRDSGLASMVQIEQRNQSFQTSLAKKTSAEIKLMNTKTDLVNAQMELDQIQQEYLEKIAKSSGEKASVQSEIASTTADISKLENTHANYSIRSGMYYIIAPQDGQFTQAEKSGLNEIVKEGERLGLIIPKQAQRAVEMYVAPMDVQLLSIGRPVRFMFDGFPALVFSGWPQASYGTFAGKVIAIESNISENGLFRVLVVEDSTFRPWPNELKLGTAANGIALLNDVMVGYELWRNINGFPPNYYKTESAKNEKKK